MSIINVIVEPNRALIAADTLAGRAQYAKDDTGETGEYIAHTCKIMAYPHISCVMTGRGETLITSTVERELNTSAPADFNSARDVMPEILNRVYEQSIAYKQHMFGVDTFEGAEVVLVGYSPTRMRFDAYRWWRYPGDDGFKCEHIEQSKFLPEIDRIGHVGYVETGDDLVALMRQQLAWARENQPDFPCGGRVMLAELTRDAVTMRMVADLESSQ